MHGGGRDIKRRGRSRGLLLAIAGLVALTALAPVADAKKKKKKKAPALTRTASAPFTQSSNASATASCPKGTHISGGGFSVAPNFNPATTTGLRSMNSTSHPSGARSWAAGGSAYATPAASGSFTANARCERNSRGALAVTLSSTVSIEPATGGDLTYTCPPGTHVLSGGYSAQSLGAFTFTESSARIVVLGSRRVAAGQWRISAFNNSNAPAAASLTGYALCALNGKKRGVSQVSAFTPVVDDGRTSADASCPKKKYLVGGGFLVSPAAFPGSVPFIGVDEHRPVGKRAWHVGLHEFVPYGLPAGSALETIAYCKQG